MATLSTTRATHSRGSVIDQKLADLNAMGANINAAIDRVLPADTQPFSSVAVLFMKWKYNDILSIASLEAELAGIFKKYVSLLIASLLFMRASHHHGRVTSQLQRGFSMVLEMDTLQA